MNLSSEMNKFDKIVREIKNLQVLGKIYLDGSDLQIYLFHDVDGVTYGPHCQLDTDGCILSWEFRHGTPYLILDKDPDLGPVAANRPISCAFSVVTIPEDQIEMILNQFELRGAPSKEEAIY